MHHSKTAMPGTVPAVLICLMAGATMITVVVGALFGLSEGYGWLIRAVAG